MPFRNISRCAAQLPKQKFLPPTGRETTLQSACSQVIGLGGIISTQLGCFWVGHVIMFAEATLAVSAESAAAINAAMRIGSSPVGTVRILWHKVVILSTDNRRRGS